MPQPINLTELGRRPPIAPHPSGCSDSIVWTNTNEDGSAASAGSDCHDWTDGTSPPGTGDGVVWGRTDEGYLWSSECKSELAGCNGSFPLFCVEQ